MHTTFGMIAFAAELTGAAACWVFISVVSGAVAPPAETSPVEQPTSSPAATTAATTPVTERNMGRLSF
ncbi:hypothetical protein GSI01S_24_00190 [Gordonia sihwensis NBRC 108236]|uniref:Uncharacterized protein n=1 Tax=Gordonia sihwensis NBRC 108236 TaxID=1223544 RepID=L7LNY3_9ACTN|nr:hypothetical protein GSI01S_24_00190 [Gordonia sihwensis NBRC 108236]